MELRDFFHRETIVRNGGGSVLLTNSHSFFIILNS